MGKRTLKEVESLYSEIENIAKSLKIDYSEMTCYMDDKSKITDVFFDIKVNGKPSNIKYTEYKELREFVKKNKINELNFEVNGIPFGASYKDSTYPLYKMVIKGKPLVCEKFLYSFVINIGYANGQSVKYVSSVNYIQELSDKDKVEVENHIKELGKMGYENKTNNKEYIDFLKMIGVDIEEYNQKEETSVNGKGAEFLEKEIVAAFDFFKTFEVEKIKLNFTINENGFLNGISDFIIYAKTNPENMTYKEFEIIQSKHITLIYNSKEIMNCKLEPRDFRNIVFCSMEVNPDKIVKYVKGIKGERLRPVLKKLEESGYIFDL